MSNYTYENIDEIQKDFYEGIIKDGDADISPDEIVSITVGADLIDFKIKTEKKIKQIIRKNKKSFLGKKISKDVYDPIDAFDGKIVIINEGHSYDEYASFEDIPQILEVGQIAHRTGVFLKINELLRDEEVLKLVYENMPKKKNGKLHARRILQVAVLFEIEDDATVNAIYAVAKDETTIEFEVRKINIDSMEKVNRVIFEKIVG